MVMPAEYRAIWNTPGGGVGYSVFHFDDAASTSEAQTIANAVRQFFNALVGLFPDEVSITFDTEVLNLSLTGVLTGVFPVVPPGGVVGSQTLAYNRAAGLRVDWTTGAIVAGRRLTGRTYLVPASIGAFDSAGLVTVATVVAVQNAGNAMLAAVAATTPMVVWSRTHSTTAGVQASTVPNKGAILTGRRD